MRTALAAASAPALFSSAYYKKHGEGDDRGDNDNNYYDKYDKGRKDDRHGGNDGKKEECKQQ